MTTNNAPIHPGEILYEEFLKPLGLSQTKLAIALHVDARRINEIVRGTRSISTDTALRLGRFLKTGPELWLNLQREYDLRTVAKKLSHQLKQIQPHKEVVA